MENGMGENEIKGLEEEIDSAVDRLFVEKQGGTPEGPLRKPPAPKPEFKMEKDVDVETSIRVPPPEPTPSKSIEKMESQLLSLEWEITKENLGKTREEVLALRESLKEKPDIMSVLGLMEKVLDYMTRNEEKIRPPLVKFLLDAKETIRLLMKKEVDNETNTYKQLAQFGIQARYACFEELKEAKRDRSTAGSKEEAGGTVAITRMDKQIEAVLNRMNLFLDRGEELLGKLDQRIVRLDQGVRGFSEPPEKVEPVSMNITIVKVGAKLFGVESDKVVKLFKVPSGFYEKYISQQTLRLKDFEVRLIDLRRIFSIQKGDAREELKILAVKDGGEYKGLMIDQVLERLSTPSDLGRGSGEYFLGKFRWTYQERPVDIPIFDLRKF